ncbi:TOBE domain-containing protein [Micromonospora sp. KLBMP9576]|uniref:TOBE domain-containing protein n=1 Tax=Micromonospora sp. KLBMP9576 TaxID=3424769 RepID=UPI003D8B884C
MVASSWRTSGQANFIETVPERIEGTTATVSVLGRQLTVEAHPKVASGSTGAYLMVRPETMRLSAVTDGGTGLGVVLRSTFHGPSIDYEVETTGGTITVTEQGIDPRDAVAEGAAVDVTFDPGRAYLLTRD